MIESLQSLLEEAHTKQEYVDAFGQMTSSTMAHECDKMGFFEAPASTKYHGARVGGLMKHSAYVLKHAVDLLGAFALPNPEAMGGDWNQKCWEEDLVHACLLHDLCKADLYIEDFRNVKNERGQWERVPYFKIKDDNTGFGHGAESLIRIQDLGYEFSYKAWAMAVYWHMGNYGLDYGATQQYMNACSRHPEVLLLHTADMMASTLEGV